MIVEAVFWVMFFELDAGFGFEVFEEFLEGSAIFYIFYSFGIAFSFIQPFLHLPRNKQYKLLYVLHTTSMANVLSYF